MPVAQQPVYCASKHGIIGFTRSAAVRTQPQYLSFSFWANVTDELYKVEGNRVKIQYIYGLPWWSSCWDSSLPMQGAWVQSLVKELRSHMLRGMIKKKKSGKVNSAGRVHCMFTFLWKKKAKICFKFFWYIYIKDRKINYTSELLFSH